MAKQIRPVYFDVEMCCRSAFKPVGGTGGLIILESQPSIFTVAAAGGFDVHLRFSGSKEKPGYRFLGPSN